MIDKEKAVIFCEWLEKRLIQYHGANGEAFTDDDYRQLDTVLVADIEERFVPIAENWNNKQRYMERLQEAQDLSQDASALKSVNNLKCELVTDKKGRKGYMPTRAHDEDAGFDLYCPYDVDFVPSQDKLLLDTYTKVEIPRGHVGLVLPRSSMIHKGLNIVTGVIDAGYTGTIKVAMTKHSISYVKISRGERVAQLVIMPIANVNLIEGKVTSDGARQDGGFGSTGA